MDQQFSAPRAEDIERLAQQFCVVDRLAELHLGRSLARDGSDLAALQELLDRGLLASTETYALQSFGVVLGMRLIAALEGFDWVIVEDEYGRDPAIRYLSTSLVLFPLTMISKRVEAGQSVDVASMFTQLCERVAEIRAEIGPS